MSVDGCVLSILKRERNLAPEDKLLLSELKEKSNLKDLDGLDDKDALIILLKRAKRDDELFHEHRYKDLEREITQLKKEKSLAELISLAKNEREKMNALEMEVFRLNREKVEFEKKFQKMRENLMEFNNQKVQQVYAIFEKNKINLGGPPLDEFNTCVNELFSAPLKFYFNNN